MSDQWFKVTATVKVKHATARDAELHVVDLLSNKPRLFPVGVLNAEPCADPTVRPREGGSGAEPSETNPGGAPAGIDRKPASRRRA